MDINMAIPVGLITNELITNSLKYAFVGREEGTLSVTASESQDEITLIVADDGVGIREIPSDIPGSLGLRLVDTLTRQLKGSMQIDREDGTTFTLIIPKSSKSER
jgi:two-component sensor histidine kinase